MDNSTDSGSQQQNTSVRSAPSLRILNSKRGLPFKLFLALSLIVAALAASIVSADAPAKTYYIKADGAANSAGTGGWNSAGDVTLLKKLLLSDDQTAQAKSGDIIYVASGDYQPDQDKSFFLPSGVKLYGGYNPNATGTNTDVSSNRDIKKYETILRGNESSVVTTVNAAETTILDGFTITGGIGTNFCGNRGGGMYNRSNSSPTVTNCTFSKNTADGDGGGMYNGNSNPTVTNCTFSENTTNGNGGGMYNYNYDGNSKPTVTNCTFSENTANSYGGGMHNFKSSPTVTNCTFSENTAGRYGGGGMNNNQSSPKVTNCTFSGNTAGNSGGGMCNDQSSSPNVTNCTFSGNKAFYSNSGGGMYNHDSNSKPTVKNCIFWGNTANNVSNQISGGDAGKFTCCVIQDGNDTYTAAGNVFTNPQLVDLADNGGPTQTMAIGEDSSAKEKGTPVDGITTDQRGFKRKVSSPDIGAFEYGAAFKITATATPENGGTISPTGNVYVEKGKDKTFTFTPNADHAVDAVKVDGTAVTPTPASPYTFTNVTANHTISVTFKKTGSSAPPSGTPSTPPADTPTTPAPSKPDLGNEGEPIRLDPNGKFEEGAHVPGAENVTGIKDKSELDKLGVNAELKDGRIILSGEPKDTGVFKITVIAGGAEKVVTVRIDPVIRQVTTLLDPASADIKWVLKLSGEKAKPDFDLTIPVYISLAETDTGKIQKAGADVIGCEILSITETAGRTSAAVKTAASTRNAGLTEKTVRITGQILDGNNLGTAEIKAVRFNVGALEYVQSADVKFSVMKLDDQTGKPAPTPDSKPAAHSSSGGCNAGFAGFALAILALPALKRKR